MYVFFVVNALHVFDWMCSVVVSGFCVVWLCVSGVHCVVVLGVICGLVV